MSSRRDFWAGKITARQLLALVLGVVALLVASLFFVTTSEMRTASDRAEAETRRFESFKLADSLRQSSDDLTRMARLYVSTGEERYRDYYEQIIATRNGTAPRPRDWEGSFWDYVLDEGDANVRYGPPVSLVQLTRRANFTSRELAVLKQALDASNTLTIVERDVMRSVGDSGTGQGRTGRRPAAVAREYRRLTDQTYHHGKARIMRLIERVVALVDARTSREIGALKAHNERLLAAQVALLATTLGVLLAGFLLLVRLVGRPLARLIGATREIADGKYDRRAPVRGALELERLAADFNDMAAAVERDIAGREAAQKDAAQARVVAEEASRAKSAFLATMSHEIRTPMSGVTGMLDVLARTDLAPRQRELVSVAQDSAQSLLELIGDVLDFSKIEAGKLELSPVPVSVRALAETAAANFHQLASAKGLVLGTDVDGRLAPAHLVDPGRVRQILNNLLSNAVKFTEQGEVVLTVRVLEQAGSAQLLELAVRDTGVGISAEEQRSLFQEFSQAGAGAARPAGSSGLGLVICRRLAEAMGGEMTLDSAPGVGTTARLRVELPLADPGAIADETEGVNTVLAAPEPTAEHAERKGTLVLVADDHPVNRTVLSQQLEAIGFAVQCAPDGLAALEEFRQGRYALVFSDLNMPRMDGFEFARAVRELEAREGVARVPLVAISASALEGERERCLAAGMDDFIRRPTTIAQLARKLQHWLPQLDWRSPDGTGTHDSRPRSRPAGGLDQLLGADGDEGLIAGILSDYLDSSRAALSSLNQGISARSSEDVSRHAHRLKGASEMVDAAEVAEVAGRLEYAAEGDVVDWERLQALLSELAVALTRVEQGPAAPRAQEPDRNQGR